MSIAKCQVQATFLSLLDQSSLLVPSNLFMAHFFTFLFWKIANLQESCKNRIIRNCILFTLDLLIVIFCHICFISLSMFTLLFLLIYLTVCWRHHDPSLLNILVSKKEGILLHNNYSTMFKFRKVDSDSKLLFNVESIFKFYQIVPKCPI